MSHAHNEWLQLWLEFDRPAVLVALISLLASGRAAWRVWRLGSGAAASADTRPGLMLTRAATISLLIALAHAYVDYSLRSGVMTQHHLHR